MEPQLRVLAASLWEMPPRQGVKIIAAGATFETWVRVVTGLARILRQRTPSRSAA